MAYEIQGRVIGTFNATADLSALQYTFVSLTTLGGIAGTTVSTDAKLFGILQNTPTSNQAAEVMVDGVSKLVAGTSSIVIGDYLASTAGGKAVSAPYSSGTTQWVAARCFETATLTSGIMTVHVFPARIVV